MKQARHTAHKAIGMLLSLLLLFALTGCQREQALPHGAAENDILTFVDNAANKPIVRIAMQYYLPDTTLLDALNAAFPDYLFIMDYSAAAGTGAEHRVWNALQQGNRYDLILSQGLNGYSMDKIDYLVDLSAEHFLTDYLISSLNNVSVGGRVYYVPGPSTLAGIAYNTEMFAEHGWQVPTNIDEFFALCEAIAAEGIEPYSACFKYASAINRMLGAMCYSSLYQRPEDYGWIDSLVSGSATYSGHMEPIYALAKRLYDTGVIPLDFFTASLTKQRQSFWAGECAMISYDSSIFAFAESEHAPFAVGIMPYPAADSADSGFAVTPEYYIGIPKAVAEDPARLALMLEVLTFLSSQEGQAAMCAGSLRISNVMRIELPDNPVFAYAREAYEKGNLYPSVGFEAAQRDIIGLQQQSIRTIFEGGSEADAIKMMDALLAEAFAHGPASGEESPDDFEVIATAERAFTMLETSCYIADKLREASGAELALMVNGGYFRSNLYSFGAGEITSDLRGFILKGIGAEDYLTTYQLTGAQLKALMERPIINREAIDAFIACAGLHIEYAPWNARGSRVIRLTNADGTAIPDDRLYTVAAFPGVIDEAYLTGTVAVHDTLGSLPDIMERALRQDKTIAPDIAGRVKLVWPAG